MDPVVVGLLGSLGSVFLVVGLFWFCYRRALRNWRRAGRRFDPLSPLTPARRLPAPFHMPTRWVAVRSSNTAVIRECLRLGNAPTVAWSEALGRSRERELFVSAPVDGWTLVIGGALPDPAQDIDAAYRFLTRLSQTMGEVHFYHTDRVLNFHAWARLDGDRVTRAYSWAGETLWNEGRMTLEERLLGLRCRAYAEEAEAPRYGEMSPEQQNTERVTLLARRWSLDPAAASEILLQQEAAEPDDDWRDT